jgi:hypothetical protein
MRPSQPFEPADWRRTPTIQDRLDRDSGDRPKPDEFRGCTPFRGGQTVRRRRNGAANPFAVDLNIKSTGHAGALMSDAISQAFDLFLQLEFLSLHFADLNQIGRGAAGFGFDLGVQITMTMVQLANPRFDSHADASLLKAK